MLLSFALLTSFLAGSLLAGTRPLPTRVDLRPQFAHWDLPLRTQGGRGTCSVFAMVGALEYALASQQRQGTVLSVEFLNWASNQATRDHADGGFFSDLWSGFVKHGVCPEADLPYRPAFDSNLQPDRTAVDRARALTESGLALHWIKPWDVNTGLTEEHFVEIKRTLARQWPVCGGLRWPKEEHWDGGVLRMAPAAGVFDGHSVLLVGYRDDATQPGGGVFLVRNSGRGDHDGALSYEYVRAYMNDAVWIDHPTRAFGAAPGQSIGDLLNPLGPAPTGRNHRVSSNQQPGWHTENLDMNWLMPGQAVEMPTFEGPGVITHMWFTSHAGWAGELNALVLRVYWDGQTEPGIEVPLADFFAVGQGRPASVESMPVQVSPTGSLSCCWRMPFRKGARITVTNDNPDRSTGLYWQVDWVKLDELPEGTPYFYARYRQEYPAVTGRDYTLADLVGSGRYVGTVMSITLAQDGWFGEGDDFFYIDGEAVPSLQGTGSEDYFNDAWGFRARTGPWFGQPRWQGDRAGDSGVCYRWHLPDAVNFSSALRLDIEHRGNCEDDLDGFFIERTDYLSSVAFWYQTGEPKRFGELPPWSQRRIPWEAHHFVKAFREIRTTGKVRPQVRTTGFFGARPVLTWANRTPGAALTLPFQIREDGRHAIRLTAANGPDGGAWRVALDGRPVLTNDFRALETTEADVLLGTHALQAGEHTLTLSAMRPKERCGTLVIESLRTLKLPPEIKRTVRTHHEAHFVRLGIGRTLYAYRLAYDRLPETLQELVKSGIMPARYASDENGRPLQSRVEAGYFVVESDGVERWKHRWQGLDARR